MKTIQKHGTGISGESMETLRAYRESSGHAIKICGISSAGGIRILNHVLPDYGGFIFVKGSRRYVVPDYAAQLCEALDPTVMRAGVFMDEDPGVIAKTVSLCGLDLIQLHGKNENAGYIKGLKEVLALGGLSPQIWAVIRRVTGNGHLTVPVKEDIADLADADIADIAGASAAVMIDAGSPDGFGGTGLTADWQTAAEISRRYKLALAGGLTPENVADAILSVHPYAVDVSSGVETAGEKDAAKAEAFIRAATAGFRFIAAPDAL